MCGEYILHVNFSRLKGTIITVKLLAIDFDKNFITTFGSFKATLISGKRLAEN